MFCSHCGKEIDDQAVICVNCGVPVKRQTQEAAENKIDGLGLAGMIVGILGAIGANIFFCMASLIGLILSSVALGQGRQKGKSSGYAIAGVIVGAVGLAVWLVIWIIALVSPA